MPGPSEIYLPKIIARLKKRGKKPAGRGFTAGRLRPFITGPSKEVNEYYRDVSPTRNAFAAKTATITLTVELPVQLARFVEEQQPPTVEAELVDASGHSHRFIDKVATFTSKVESGR